MKRKLLFPERIMYGNGCRPFNLVSTVKIRGTFTLENLQLALAKIQDKHPVLSATIEEDEKGTPWFVSREKTVEIPIHIVQRYSDDDWINEIKKAWNRVFDIKKEPLIRVIWLKSDTVSELMLALHHCVSDGATSVNLTREVLALLDYPGARITATSSFNGIGELVPEPVLRNKRTIFKGKALSLATRIILSLALFRSRKKTDRGNNFIYHWKLSQSQSSIVFKRCKAEGVTVNTALCLAFFLAMGEVKGKGFLDKVTCPVDIRKHVPAIKHDMAFAFGLALTLLPGRKPFGDFWTRAKMLQAEVSKKLARINAYKFLMTLEYFHPLAKLTERFLIFGRYGKALLFSNLGRLDIPANYRSFDVETIYSLAAIGPFRNPNSILTSTFKGRMDFCLVSTDNFMQQEEARIIKEKAMAMLLKTDIPG